MKNTFSLGDLYTQIDVSRLSSLRAPEAGVANQEVVGALHAMVALLDRQNRLLEELVSQLATPQRQRNAQLEQWRKANPQLVRQCRDAAETLGKVQVDFLETLVSEVERDSENLTDSEFALNEFVDRYGPRLAHLGGVLQLLGQLGSTSAPPPSE